MCAEHAQPAGTEPAEVNQPLSRGRRPPVMAGLPALGRFGRLPTDAPCKRRQWRVTERGEGIAYPSPAHHGGASAADSGMVAVGCPLSAVGRSGAGIRAIDMQRRCLPKADGREPIAPLHRLPYLRPAGSAGTTTAGSLPATAAVANA